MSEPYVGMMDHARALADRMLNLIAGTNNDQVVCLFYLAHRLVVKALELQAADQAREFVRVGDRGVEKARMSMREWADRVVDAETARVMNRPMNGEEGG